jgi:hypothetical protein
MDTNEIYFPNGRREQFTDDELDFLKKEIEKFTSLCENKKKEGSNK